LLSNQETGFQPLSILPNPATGWAKLRLPENIQSSIDSRVELRDAAGRLVQVQELTAGVAEVELLLENLPPGFYFLSLRTAGGDVYVGKLMKQ